MSETTTTTSTPTPAPPATFMGSGLSLAQLVISSLVMIIYIILIAVSYFNKDQQSFNILCGAAVVMAQTVVAYNLGSSAGSATKTALLAASPAIPTATNTTVVTKSAAP